MSRNLLGNWASNTGNAGMKVEWESLSATSLRVYFTLDCDSEGLASGNDRVAWATVYDPDNTSIGSDSVTAKSYSSTWSIGETHTCQIDVTIPYRTGGTLKLTCKVMKGNSGSATTCKWDATADTNYPSLDSISWPVYNTPPYWAAGSVVTVSPNGTVPENTSSFAISWPAASDAQGDTRYYDVYRWVDGVSTKIASAQAGRTKTDSHTIGSGHTLKYTVKVKDAYGYGSQTLQSSNIYGNVLTGAVLSTVDTIEFASSVLELTNTPGSNSNGNASLTLALTADGLTVHNSDVTALSGAFNLTIHKAGGAPAGPYIEWADLKAKYADASYLGTLKLILTTTNAYGSSSVSNLYVPVDLRCLPAGLGNVAYSGEYTIESVPRYLPDQRAITVEWDAATDALLGTGITYAVMYRVHGTAPWTTAATGLTVETYDLTPPSGDDQIAYDVKVVAYTSYGTSAEASGATLNVDKYLRPLLQLMYRKRNSTSIDVTLLVTFRSSFDDDLELTVFTYTKVGGSTVSLTLTNLNPSYTYTEGGVLTNSTSYTMVASIQDNAGVVLGADPVTVDIPVPSYIPMLAVRKKGVGVNCINDGTGNYMLTLTGKVNSVADANGYLGFFKNGVEIGGSSDNTELELFMGLRRMRRLE